MAEITDTRTLWHDTYCRGFLDDLMRASELLRLGMAEGLRAGLTDDPPLLAKTSHVETGLQARHLDFRFLFRRKRGGYLELLLEHKSSAAASVPGQVALYTKLALDSPAHEDVRQVMAAVLYHGRGRWTAPHALEWGADGSAPPRQEAGVFGYPLWNLMKLDLGRLKLSPTVWAGVAAMVGAFREEARDALLEPLLDALEPGARFTQQTLVYLSAQWGLDIGDLQDRLTQLKPETGGDTMGRTFMDVAMESEAKGLAEGLAKGEAKGKAETLLKLLRLKFGDLPTEAESAVLAASAGQLDAWTAAVLTAPSLDEVLAAQPSR